MNQTRSMAAAVAAGTALFYASTALGHISIAGPAYAGSTSVLMFNVGHGCEGADTYEVAIAIPEGITSVRAMPSPAFDQVQVVLDEAELPTSVVFRKAPETARPADDQFYQVGLRVAVPDTPFARLFFPATQRCRPAEGEDIVAEWSAQVTDHDAEGEELPAPVVMVMPARTPGWNQYTAPAEMHSLEMFDDAQIVWVGDAAYSANPVIQALIESDEDVTLLETIPADAEIWVKY